MENNLPSENYLPEDEYPELGAEPIEAAEPVIPTADEEPAPAQEAPPAQQTADPAQPPYPPQGAAPYMPYPFYPPMTGMPYPPQPMPQQPMPQQPMPQQGMYYGYPAYYMPYPPQPPIQQAPPQPSVMPVQSAPQPQPTEPVQPVSVPELRDEKKPASTGTKAFLIILCALLLAMVAGFIVYIANISDKDTKQTDNQSDPFSLKENENELFNLGSESDDIDLEHSEFEEKITLVADDGATQKRDTDNPDSAGKPDKNAKGIELRDEPKDKDDTSKYSAKSSFNALADSVVTIACYEDEITENIYDIKSSGSGTIISSDGYVITNAHVLNNSKMYAVNVILNDGKKYRAKIIGYDTWTDLAVLKIDAKDLKPAEFGSSDTVEVGDDVIAIGSPGGAKYQNTLTQGVISAVDREISINKCVRYIQSDATINPGSSGGPLCNLCGQVIGITTAKTVAQYYENMSFSIPSALVKDVVNDLIRYGYVPDRARIGFSGSEVSADDKLYYGLPSGVIIGEIAEDGALAGSGIKKYDIVTAIDGEEIASFQDIYNILAKHKKGDKVTLSVYRIEDKDFLKAIEESE